MEGNQEARRHHCGAVGFMKRKETLPDENGQEFEHNAVEFFTEDQKMATDLQGEKAEDFKKLNMKIIVLDTWTEFINQNRKGSDKHEPVNDLGDTLNTTLLAEKLGSLNPTLLVSGWCFSATSEILLEKLGITAKFQYSLFLIILRSIGFHLRM